MRNWKNDKGNERQRICLFPLNEVAGRSLHVVLETLLLGHMIDALV